MVSGFPNVTHLAGAKAGIEVQAMDSRVYIPVFCTHHIYTYVPGTVQVT